jgi:hypothetical protein
MLWAGAAEFAYYFGVLEDDEGGRVGDVVALGDLGLRVDADPGEGDSARPRQLLPQLVVDRGDGLARLVVLVVNCNER